MYYIRSESRGWFQGYQIQGGKMLPKFTTTLEPTGSVVFFTEAALASETALQLGLDCYAYHISRLTART
jgi:hypothetical protein